MGSRNPLQAQGAPTPTDHHPNLPPSALPERSPGSLQPNPALPGWPGAPQVRALGPNSSRGEQGPPSSLLAVYPAPEPRRCRAAPAEFAQGYDVQRPGNEREYFAFERERNPVCCVKFRDPHVEKKTKKHACGCDEKASQEFSPCNWAGCEIRELGTEGTHERRRDRGDTARAGV